MRCKSCNTPLKSSEIIWYEKEHKHEDLCDRCKGKFYSEYIAMGWNVEKLGLPESQKDEDNTDEK